MKRFLHLLLRPFIHDSRHWYRAADLQWPKAVLLGTLCYSLVLLAYYGPIGEAVRSRVVHPMEFRLRDRLDRSPQLDPRIVVFAVDHKALGEAQGETISPDDWVNVLKTLGEARPKAIFIDHPFTRPMGRHGNAYEKIKNALQSGPPVVGGVTVSPDLIPERPPLSLQGAPYELEYLIPGDRKPASFAIPDWLKVHTGFAYGPDPKIFPALKAVGQTHYLDDGTIYPIYRISENQGIPHWGLLFPGQIAFRQGGLSVNQLPVPVDGEGKLLVNLSRPSDYHGRIYSLQGLLQRARSGAPLERMSPNTVAVVLTQMYPGEISVRNTPLGKIPESYVLLSVLNSALTGNWLYYVGWAPLTLFLFCMFGAFLAVQFRPLGTWLSTLAVGALTVAAGLYGFAFHGIVMPWAFWFTALCGTCFVMSSEKMRMKRLKAQMVKSSLSGLIDPQHLKYFISHPSALHLEPRSQIVTLVSIEIVGFSRTAESKNPSMVFDYLKELMRAVEVAVHDFGGVIEKITGDRMFCYFGAGHDDSAGSARHPEEALRCAVRLQKECLTRNLSARRQGRAVYPLKIGIHTAEAYIGDVGPRGRLQFTVVGHGVEYVHKLETACELYSVLCSRSTRDKLVGLSDLEPHFSKRLIQMKNASEVWEGFEYDPFHDDTSLREEGMKAFREELALDRGEERFPVEAPYRLKVRTDRSEGLIRNFSLSGLLIETDEYYSSGSTLELTFSSEDGSLQKLWETAGIASVTGEVRWGRPEGNRFVHGLLLKNLSQLQKETLISCFREALKPVRPKKRKAAAS